MTAERSEASVRHNFDYGNTTRSFCGLPLLTGYLTQRVAQRSKVVEGVPNVETEIVEEFPGKLDSVS